MPKTSSSSSAKRPRADSVRTTRRSRSGEGLATAERQQQPRDEEQQADAGEKSDAVSDREKEKQQQGVRASLRVKQEAMAAAAAAAVAPRGRGRSRKVREVPVAVEIIDVDQSQPDETELQQDDAEPQISAHERKDTDGQMNAVDADVVVLDESQEEPNENEVGTVDGDAETEPHDVDGDAGQREDDAASADSDHHEPAQDEVPLEVTEEKSSAAETPSRHLSSSTSDNGSTASGSTHAKPDTNNKRGASEEQQQQQTTKSSRKKQKTGAKISPAASRNLFQFTCRLLESQKLEYEVRACEFEEKNALLAATRAKWEKKIRSVKRQLSGYGHPVDEVRHETGSGSATATHSSNLIGSNTRAAMDQGSAPTSIALTTTADAGLNGSSTGGSTSLITMRDALSNRTNFSPSAAGAGGVTDSLLPAGIHNLEAQIRDTLGARAQLVQGMVKDLQDMRGFNEKITRLR